MDYRELNMLLDRYLNIITTNDYECYVLKKDLPLIISTYGIIDTISLINDLVKKIEFSMVSEEYSNGYKDFVKKMNFAIHTLQTMSLVGE